jgi:hypothetical protein
MRLDEHGKKLPRGPPGIKRVVHFFSGGMRIVNP